MTVRIVTDSSCDLPQELADQYGIKIVPLTIRFGDTEYVDREALTPSHFWALSSASDTLPETAAPAPGLFEVAYRELAAEGATGIVVIALSEELSATKQSAEIAAKAVADEIDVRVVDSQSFTLGVGGNALACARLAESGADIATVVERATDIAARTHVIGALDTLDNLKKGGRIGNARALLASALSIKPIIEVIDGRVAEGGKQRTRSKALRYIADRVRADADRIETMAVLHADCSDVDQFVAQIAAIYPGEIVVGQLGPVVGAHAGLGTIGVAYSTRD